MVRRKCVKKMLESREVVSNSPSPPPAPPPPTSDFGLIHFRLGCSFSLTKCDPLIRSMQVFLEQLEGELESENPWERVVSLVDTQTEIVEDFKDTSRMTSMLIQLKNDPLDVSTSQMPFTVGVHGW